MNAGQELRSVGVVGAGAMGRGIAQVCASAGCDVLLYDTTPEAVARALAFVADDLKQAVSKGRLAQGDADAVQARIRPIAQLREMSGCDLVVEAIIEQLDAKQQLFRQLEELVGDGCILATNTSSLSVTAIAASCKQPGRVAGWHFFNPVMRMKVVEVVQAPRTAPDVTQALAQLSRKVGHRPIVTFDSPGFVVNHAGRAFVTEGLKLFAERAADHTVLDAILRNCAGFRMGPFELLDLTALDVSVPVMESIHSQFYGDDRYRPVPLARTRLTAGLLGRKSGQGFYSYDKGQGAAAPTEGAALPAATKAALWWRTGDSHPLPQSIVDLLPEGSRQDDPARADAILLAPLGRDLTAAVTDLGVDASRAVAVDPVFCGPNGVTLMACPATTSRAIDAVRAAFAAQNIPTWIISDSPGYIAPRVVACIVNLACEMAQQGIASPEDIDQAVRLGLGYPQGPFAWGDKLGASRVLQILEGLHTTFRDPRYRPSPWLVRRARLSLSLSTPDRAG